MELFGVPFQSEAEYTASIAVVGDYYSRLSLDELVRVCRDTGAADAWEEFVSRTRFVVASGIRITLRRWGMHQPDSEDDLIQEVYLRISRNQAESLRRFEPAHSNGIFGFLRTVASNLAHDYCRSLVAAKRGIAIQEAGTKISQRSERPDRFGGAVDIEKQVLLEQIDQILRSVTSGVNRDRDRRIFWMHYRHGMTALSIASVPNLQLTVKGVESTLQRLTRLVRAELAEQNAEQRAERDIAERSSSQKAVIGE